MRTYSSAAFAVLVLTGAPAHAITGDFVKDFEHPYVGLAVFYDQSGEFSHRCSGALFSFSARDPIQAANASRPSCSDGETFRQRAWGTARSIRHE